MLTFLRTTYLCSNSLQRLQAPSIDPASPNDLNFQQICESKFEGDDMHSFRSTPHCPACSTKAVIFLSPNKNTFFSDLLTMRTMKNRMKLIIIVLNENYFSDYFPLITIIYDNSHALVTHSGVFIVIFYIQPVLRRLK